MPNPVRFSEVKSTKPSMRVRDVTISNSTTPGGLGPTEVTGFWNTVSVPPSGYIVYENKPVNGPSIMVYYNKEDTVERLYLMFPEALRNIYDLPEYARLPFAVSYANTQNGVLVVNKDFPDVPLVGLVCNIDPTFLMSYPRTGNTINDISGDGDNDGTLVDVGWGAEIDGCLILNGTTSYIDLGSGPDFDFGTNDFSISVWFRMDASPIDSSPVILGKGTTGATGIVMYVLDNAIAVNIDNSNGLYDLKSTSTINDNDWHNIVVIRKGDVYQLIVDTYEEVNITLTGKTITTKDTMLVGKYGDNTKYFDGKIGPIQIYNRALYARIAPPTTNLQSYFYDGTDPNGDPIPESIVDWDTRNVTNMTQTFYNAQDFNLDISGWDTGNVTNMSGTFKYNFLFNQDIGGWDVSNVTVMLEMFSYYNTFVTTGFNNGGSPSINNWNVSNVTNMSNMFRYCTPFNQPIGNWDVGNVTSMYSMLHKTSFDQNIGNWNVSKVTDMYSMFSSTPFNNGGSPSISGWTTSGVTNMTSMFTSTPFNQPIGSWDVSNVNNMTRMFTSAYSFNQPIGDWDVSNVIYMGYMFDKAKNFDQDIGNWDVSNVVDMQQMFTQNRFDSDFAFNNGGSPSISGWTTSGVTNMNAMFSENIKFNQPIGSWDVSNVINMSTMFNHAWDFNQPLNEWNVGNVTNMFRMFWGAIAFDQDLGDWDISNVTNMSGMFSYSNMSTENYSNTLIGWAAQAPNIQTGVTLDAVNIKYNAYATEARNLLTGVYDWSITDASIDEDIVMDGLVFSVDAGNTTSYVSGSTTWNDLVGDNDGTLINGPTFDSNNRGSIVFDGTDDYVDCGNNSSLDITTGVTLSCIFYTTGVSSRETGIQKGMFNIDSGMYGLQFANNRVRFALWNSAGDNNYFDSTAQINNSVKHVMCTWDGSTMKIYINGVLDSSQSYSTTLSTNTKNLGIGKSIEENSYYFDGNIYTSQIYNRALSDAEVLQNYNAQKGRFGL